MAAKKILDKDVPSTLYSELFEEEGDEEAESLELKEQLAAFNAFMRELSRRYNEGLSYSLEELGRPSAGPLPDSLEDLPGWLEDLYVSALNEKDYTLLNSAFHLLCSRGESFEPVRD